MSAKIGSPYLKTLTAQGNLLPTLNITTELTDKVSIYVPVDLACF